MSDRISSTPTAYAVRCLGTAFPLGVTSCHDGAPIFLTPTEYHRQMSNPDALWKCPVCRGNATFDDEIYEDAVYGERCNEFLDAEEDDSDDLPF